MNRSIFIFTILVFLFNCPRFSMGQYVEDRIVVAQYGEGIYSILERNELEPSKYLANFIELNLQKLAKDSTLIAGQIYTLPEPLLDKKLPVENPALKGNQIYFGEKYSPLKLKDSLLNDAVYYLVSGHGGPDPGAIGHYKNQLVSEDEYSYDVTLRLAKNLLEQGAKVYMIVQDADDGIRDDDILLLDKDETTYPGLKMPINQRARLMQRTESINKLYHENLSGYQRLVVIHIDSRSEGENIDVFFYHHHRSKNGEKLATEIQQVIKSKYARYQPNRNYYGTVSSRSNLFLVKNTFPPMVYIELGNIKNKKDQRRFILSDNRQALANWMTEGIINDYKNASKK